MSVTLKEHQEMLHQMVVDFAKKEVQPLDMHIDKYGYPKELWNKVIETGFLSLIVPKEYGGAEFDAIAEAQTIYDIARNNASLAFTLEGHYKTVDQIKKFASKELKAKYLPQAERKIFGFGSTEPQGGSNIMGHSASAVRDGDYWILNGNKTMITNGGLAEVYLVLLKTDKEELTCFLVDKDMPGFKYGKQEDFFGMRGTPVGEIFLENVKVTEDYMVGKIGDRSEEHTSELQSRPHLVCRLLLEKKNKTSKN